MKLEQALTHLAEGARQMLRAGAAAVRLLDEGGAHLTVAATCGLPDVVEQETIAVTDSPLDQEALTGTTLVIADTAADVAPQAANLPQGYRSVACMPLVDDGDPLGVLHVYAAAPHHFDEQSVARLTPLAKLGAVAVASTRIVGTLEARETSEARFIHVATHELRSPVAVSQSLVRTVLKGYAGEMTDQQVEIFHRISRRLDFLEQLVDDLLDLAAGKASELAEGETAVALNASVGRAVLLLQPSAEEKNVDLVYRGRGEELVVRGTEDGLDRIFVNLVGNAIKYTPSGGKVTVSLQCLEEEAQAKVSDTGIGIPEEAMRHLFDEFYRAPNAKASGEVGTGLGLTIVKDLVDRYGGRIEVESAVGEGSTFTVTFPVLTEW